MRKNDKLNSCVLGIAPSARGFGYAVMKGKTELVDWGVKPVKSGKKNERSLAHAANLIAHYSPHLIAIEDSTASRQRARVQELIQQIVLMAEDDGIKAKRLSRPEVNLEILKTEQGTKHALAKALAAMFPEQLGFRLPRKRRDWASESYQSDIFWAVALAQCAIND